MSSKGCMPFMEYISIIYVHVKQEHLIYLFLLLTSFSTTLQKEMQPLSLFIMLLLYFAMHLRSEYKTAVHIMLFLIK